MYNMRDEILRQLDEGIDPTKASLWKWKTFIKNPEKSYSNVGPQTCPYCIVIEGLPCKACPFVTHGMLHNDCMAAGNPFVSVLRTDARGAWTKLVYDYIYNIGLAQAKEAVTNECNENNCISGPSEFAGMVQKYLDKYGVSDYKFNIPHDCTIPEFIDYIFPGITEPQYPLKDV